MSNLVVNSKAVAFRDSTPNNNPQRKHFDWTRGVTVSVQNPKTAQESIPAGSSFTFFNGTTSTSIDGTTAFTVTRDPNDPSRYRFTATGGTAPGLRTNRGLTLTGQNVTIAVNPDATVDMILGGGTWGTVAAGDIVFIPGPTTGDTTTPFTVLNEGFWTVIAVLSATHIQCERVSGTDFQATSEIVALTTNAQVVAFSAAGVQVGDQVEISAAFAPATQRTFQVDRVTATWFEVVSTSAVPLEVGKVPTATGIKFYSGLKRFIRVEADQEVSVRLNGSTDDTIRLSPLQAGDMDQVGWFEKWGATWSLVVVNKSSRPVTVDLFSAE